MREQVEMQVAALRASLREVESMIAEISGEGLLARVEREGWEQHKQVLLLELEALEGQAREEPAMALLEMTFRGDAVVGSIGIEPALASVVAAQVPKLVHATRRRQFPRRRGGAALTQPPEPKLLLTGTVRGSFGLRFEEVASEVASREAGATPLHESCAQVVSLLTELAESTTPLDVYLTQPATIRAPLRTLLEASVRANVSMRLSGQGVSRELGSAQLARAARAVSDAQERTTRQEYFGRLIGLNPVGRAASFTFLTADQERLEGVAPLAASDDEALELVGRYSGQECWVLLTTSSFERRGVREERHELVALAGERAALHTRQEMPSDEEG